MCGEEEGRRRERGVFFFLDGRRRRGEGEGERGEFFFSGRGNGRGEVLFFFGEGERGREGGGQKIVSLPKHTKYVSETNDETSQVFNTKVTVLRHKNWSCKNMEDMYCDSDDNNVILFTVINTS